MSAPLRSYEGDQVMTMAAWEILEKAADLVEFSGRWVNRHPSPDEVCMSYAIADVTRGRRVAGMSRAEYAARRAVDKEIGPGPITWFNDAKGRTKEEVAAALRNAERHLKPEATA